MDLLHQGESRGGPNLLPTSWQRWTGVERDFLLEHVAGRWQAGLASASAEGLFPLGWPAGPPARALAANVRFEC